MTNYLGNFCSDPEENMLKESATSGKCHKNWAHIFSLANKKDMPDYYAV